MNKQGKDGIEWCDYTWNPVTGCLHNCPYCYAAKMYKRFGLSFEPTFHPERLTEPAMYKIPHKIFVVSAGDLFGDWVPDEWIRQVYEACQKADHHKYLFLTKNPKRYSAIYRTNLDYRYNMWLGTTITNENDLREKGVALFKYTGMNGNRSANRFLSIEPLLGAVSFIEISVSKFKWIIIGQQTGPGAVKPKDEWVQSIIDQCKAANVPVFVKSPLYEKFPIQEWPEGLKERDT